MSEDLFVRHCAPTLAGLKTGNLFTCRFDSKNEMNDSVRNVNRRLKDKGLRFIPMRYNGKTALLYLYRPEKLKADFTHAGAKNLLTDFGYSPDCPEKCISCLRRKLIGGGDFPHEIGLFLGYPPEDVRGFIEQGSDKCKCAGCWKVYGDEESALKLFEKYKKCTDIYTRKHDEGYSVEKLAVLLK